MTARDIEIEIARHLDYRHNLIVPNVAWGMGMRGEADMIVLRKSGLADEIEIKVAASDITADRKKPWHMGGLLDPLFSRLWFAVPESLCDHPHIPSHAGIYAVEPARGRYRSVRVHRPPALNAQRKAWTPEQRRKLAELGCMRIWTLKERLTKGGAK